MRQLQITVAAGQHGPLFVLRGESDMTTAPELNHALAALLASGARYLTVDIAELTFADSASIQALVLAARALHERGGEMVLLSPQPIVARVLSLLGVDQMVTVRLGAETGPEAEAV